MRKLISTITDSGSELIKESAGCLLPWVRSIRKAGEYVEQEVDITMAQRKKELLPIEE